MKKILTLSMLLAVTLALIGLTTASMYSDSSVSEIKTFGGSIMYQDDILKDRIIEESLKISGNGWECIGMYTVDAKTLDTLVILKKGSKIKYVEIYRNGENMITKEVTPKIIEEKAKSEVIYNKNETAKEKPAEIIKRYGKIVSKLELLTASPVVVEAWSGIEAKNALGITLWKLTAKGYFHIYTDDRVFYVADDSSAYANGYLGWSIDYFDSDATWTSIAGKVDARAGFDNPLADDVDAWAWVQVDNYLHITRDAGYN